MTVVTESCPLCSVVTYLTHRFLGTLVCQDCYACSLELKHLANHNGDTHAEALFQRAASKVNKSGKAQHVAIQYAERNW